MNLHIITDILGTLLDMYVVSSVEIRKIAMSG
jgi:hypothetical protein